MPEWSELFSRFLAGQRKVLGHCVSSSIDDTALSLPSWRVIPLETRTRAAAGGHDGAASQTQFLSFEHAPQAEDHLAFLEHSIVAFDQLVSSQIRQQQPAIEEDVDPTVDFSTSFATSSLTNTSNLTSEEAESHDPSLTHLKQIDIHGGISNLKQIPTADYITSILPQTMTVNLLVGVVTIAAPRTVHLRRSNAEMDIVELVVGDETRAGFTVSFWLAPAESQSKPADDLRDSLRRLCSGDVVLLQNVALSCFRGCVYGQSLSKRFARNTTLVTVLGDEMVGSLPQHFHPRLRRVGDWIGEFVGVNRNAMTMLDEPAGRRADAPGDLPPDTQD